MEDIADLGLSAVEYGIDRYHDRVYDGASAIPGKIKVVKRKFSKTPDGEDIVVEQKQTLENNPANDQPPRVVDNNTTTVYPTQPDNTYPRRRRNSHNPSAPIPLPPLPEHEAYNRRRYRPPQMSARDDGYGSDGGYTRYSGAGHRSSRGLDRDTHEPEQAGLRSYAGRDGYEPTAYSGAAYDAAERGEDPRYLEYDGRTEYSRRDREDDYRSRRDYDDEEEEGNRDLAMRRRSGSRGGSRGTSRPGSSRGFGGEHHKGQNDKTKEWGATIAGAAVGAFGARAVTSRHGQHKENWVPTAIGAVVGGLIAREAEKEYFKRKEHKDERREMEEDEYAGRRY